MLETLHTREYYLEKAEGLPLLERVVSGETTFTRELDGIFTRIMEASWKKKELLDGFLQYY